MKLSSAACSVFLLLLSFLCFSQTEAIRGQISGFVSKPGFKVHIAQFQGDGFIEQSAAPVSEAGAFDMTPASPLRASAYLLWFDSGDTISFIGGADKRLEFKGRWYESMVVEMQFPGSSENATFHTLKEEIRKFRFTEDSLNHTGRAINEFDSMYSKKSAVIKEYFLQHSREYNKRLGDLQAQAPMGYCGRAIIPVLFRNNMGDDPVTAKNFDNNRAFQHYHFFGHIPNDSLVATNPFLREKIYDYMNIWVNQQNEGLQTGVDEVMKKFSGDDALKKYALSALTDYFTGHNNFALVDYLYNNYYSTCEMPTLQGKSAEVIEQIKRLAPGNKAPELIMPDTEGKYFLLSQMKPRKYIVLVFWASWCPHCQKMMPEALAYYHQVKNKGVDFVGVSLDDKKSDRLDYINANKLDWTNISDLRRYNSEAVKLYALRGTPTFYVLDASLTIVGKASDLNDLKKLIR